nr:MULTISPECIES: hypothetical protein [Brevundimonas]
MNDAVAAISVAIDRGGIPFSAPGARNTSGVQVTDDCARGRAGSVAPENFSHHIGLNLVHIPQASHWLPKCIEFAPNAVAVDATARVTARPDDALQTAPRLAADFLQLKRIHRPLQADVKLRDIVLRDRADTDSMKPEILKRGRYVCLGSRQSIQGLADHQIELASFGARHQCLQTRAVGAGRARDAGVLISGADFHSLALGIQPTDGELILDRCGVLEIA